jgi:transposase
MRQASKRVPDSAEKMVRDIRRATWRHHSAEEKIRIVLEGLRGEAALPNSAARRGSTRTLIIVGRKSSWRQARSGSPATRRARRPRARSRISGLRPGSSKRRWPRC